MSISAKLDFTLNGKSINAPIEWNDIEILASFDNESVQANISTDKFTFVNAARAEILNYIQEGESGGLGIFEGLPFSIAASNSDTSISVFDGFLDLSDELSDLTEEGRIEASIVKQDGLNSLEDRLSAITYEYLYQEGFITDDDFIDVPYVVVKPTSFIEVAILSISVYLLAKSVAEQAEKISRTAANAAAHLTGGATGSAASTAFLFVSLGIDIAYALQLIAAITNLLISTINTLNPIKRNHKGIKVLTLLSAAADFVGYQLETDLSELDKLVYLPSNPNTDTENINGLLGITGSIKKGIPNTQDNGYQVLELFNICKRLFYAKFAISDNGTRLQFRSEGSSYWLKTASYELPDVLLNEKRYNTDQLNANKLFSFDTDISDKWTISNFKGTSYEVITDAITTSTPKRKALKGLGEVRFGVCLGNKKETLTPVENILLGLATAADALINSLRTFTQKPESTLANQIKSKINLLKVSDNNHSKPKLLLLDDAGVIVPDDRSTLSAKALYENYHSFDSFVQGNYNGQKIVYNGVKVPFGLNDYIKLADNSYIATSEGNQAKVTAVRWRLGADYAIIDFWIRQPYTKNLKETFIEPD